MDNQGIVELKAFEGQVDAQIESLGILRCHQLAVLSSVYAGIRGIFAGNDSLGRPADSDRGATAVNRMSHLAPLIIGCPTTPLLDSSYDAFDSLRDVPDWFEESQLLLKYGHFSELMPEVHKGYYDVRRISNREFDLVHPSPEFTAAEEQDILLSEISTPVLLQTRWATEQFDELLEESDEVLMAQLIPLVALGYDRYRTAVLEVPLVSDDGLLETFGVSLDEFYRFRAAWIVWADVCIQMCDAAARATEREGRSEYRARQLAQWSTVLVYRNYIEGSVRAIVEIGDHALDALMDIFLLGGLTGDDANYGDGFFPPFLAYDDRLVFSPDAVRTMMATRNLAYAINRVDEKRFADVISKHLEPKLIDDTVALLPLEGLEVVKNARWHDGEFDLLVYSPRENAALHVQAKASIAPHGARMTQHTEDRWVSEGLRQFEVFRALSQLEKDDVLSAALNRSVENVEVVDVALARSSFGTAAIWNRFDNIVPCNLAVIAYLASSSPSPFTLRDFGSRVTQLMEEMRAEASPRWERESVDFGVVTLGFPLLRLEPSAIAGRRAWTIPNELTVSTSGHRPPKRR